jgi:NAD(P)H-hydrate epimerase
LIEVITPDEMKAVDAAAPEPTEVLVHRAGGAVARIAIDMLGGVYGRRVVVVAGKGNNGADGRDTAARLGRRGVRVHVI